MKLSHGNNPALGQGFIELIEEAFAQHRQWRHTQDSTSFFDCSNRVGAISIIIA
ncbi:hypothetical protein [Coleofasciculus sp. F4-SAH-05]|uniref:hypothetical protein n=1 Tax=Coleofasciculus TaxID=669368 RepID=UPI0032F0AF30